MNKYLKCFISFFLGGLCIYLGINMSQNKDQQAIVYFLHLVGILNFAIGIKDLISIIKGNQK
ncbi:MAG: hypothetical protein ACUVXF_09705 [Desulfobaccales bacterium]